MSHHRPKWLCIVDRAAMLYDTTTERILSHTRERQTAHARQECYMRMRDDLGMSYPAIGHRMNRDHTTVIYGIRAARARLDGETQ